MANLTTAGNYQGEPPPCDFCSLSRACAQQQLACKAYREWRQDNRWTTTPGMPNHKTYQVIYETAG